MVRKHTVSEVGGEKSVDVVFTLQEEIDRDFVESNPLPPPTDEERIDAAFPQTDVARVLFEVIWTFANEIEALKTGIVFDPDKPIFTRAQVKTKLKNILP